MQYVAWFLRTHLSSAKISKAQQLLPPKKGTAEENWEKPSDGLCKGEPEEGSGREGENISGTLGKKDGEGRGGGNTIGRGDFLEPITKKKPQEEEGRKEEEEKIITVLKERGNESVFATSLPTTTRAWKEEEEEDKSLDTHRHTQIWRKKRASASKCKMFFKRIRIRKNMPPLEINSTYTFSTFFAYGCLQISSWGPLDLNEKTQFSSPRLRTKKKHNALPEGHLPRSGHSQPGLALVLAIQLSGKK